MTFSLYTLAAIAKVWRRIFASQQLFVKLTLT